MKSIRQIKMFFRLGIASVLLLLTGCASIHLVSDYDEAMDKGSAALHKKFDAYFVSLQTLSTEDRKYRNHQKFYEEALVDLNSLKVRASAIYKNELTQEQLEIIEENLAYLVLLHKGCVTAALTEDQKEKVKENGIDISLECKKEHGASDDIPDRGDEVLNRYLVPPIQAMFDQKFGAVMALELAKKRGEDE